MPAHGETHPWLKHDDGTPYVWDSRFGTYIPQEFSQITAAQAAVIRDADPRYQIISAEIMPSPHGGALPLDANAQAASLAVGITLDILTGVEQMQQQGASTPEIRTTKELIMDTVQEARAAYDRNDAPAAVRAAETARQLGQTLGIVNNASLPATYQELRATAVPAVTGLTNAGYVPDLQDNRSVTMQQNTIPEGMTVGELNDLLKAGFEPIRPDGGFYIVTDFAGGFLLDGAPLNCWIDGVWFAGQQELLTPYWQAGQIPQPPANIMLLPIVGMPEDVAANYAASQGGGGLGVLAILGLAASFFRK